MELRKEYQDIAGRIYDGWLDGKVSEALDACTQVARACQELADRPPRELTDEEIEVVLEKTRAQSNVDTCRAAIAADRAKQREPESEPLNLEKLATGEFDLYYNGYKTEGVMLAEFVADPHQYTMRRKA